MKTRAITIIIPTLAILALIFVPKNLQGQDQTTIPVPVHIAAKCQQQDCYILSEEEMMQLAKEMFSRGYQQCKIEVSI